MKHLLTTALLFLSIGVMGQTKITPAHTEWGTSIRSPDIYIGDYNYPDTVAVYMLVSNRVKHGYTVQVMQLEGYSVTPRIFYNTLPFSTYLNKEKKPLPGNVIVWMAIPRKEDCGC